MASSSTSSIQKRFKYEVFLSFRGADTRNNFVGHLYNALQQKSIETYKDDEKINKGENISNELITSIENSKFYIIVFSKNYASSAWCLDELVKIMECQRTADHTAYPLFYDVEPWEVRKQSGAVTEPFVKNEKKEAAGKWREALKEAADLAGWELKNTANGDEAKLIKIIVEELSLDLRSIRFDIDKDLVGMESRIKEVLSSFGTDSNDVRMIGIKGMGGGGKTTLARAVYDQISHEFEGKSFIENVREDSKPSLSGLNSLQCQVLSDVFEDGSIRVSSVSDGKHLMKKMMYKKKVLVVLDDVDHIDQLQALAGEPNWFKMGSRIIITTKDEQVLVAHGVKFGVKFNHDVNLLSDKEATFLFCRYAFGRDIPLQGYEELSKQVVRYADGLPLTIKVLGSFLCCKNELEWKDALERLKKIPLQETQEKLELSYISLEDDYKEIFLDVVCIFKNWTKDDVIKALESCGFRAINGLRVLERKSLLTFTVLSSHLSVKIHDHIKEMGRNIVRRSHPPYKHSRLWDRDEIEYIFANDLGTEATKCIRLDAPNLNPYMVKGLGKMKQLRFLSVYLGRDCFSDLEFDIVSPDFPNALQYLEWTCYPFRSLPVIFQANNLVTLEMKDSRMVQLWEGEERKVLNKLKNLDLSYSSLMSTLDLRLAPNLEKLILNGCTSLEELHMPVDCLNLTTIEICDSKLRTLDLAQTPNIEVLDLTNSNYLEELHMAGECQKLYGLGISSSKLKSLDIRLARNLEALILTNNYDLEDLCMAAGYQDLTYIIISHSKLKTFNLGLTPNVERLELTYCYHLEELQMTGECQKLLSLKISHSRLRTFNLGLTPNLEKLRFIQSFNLVELHIPDGCLKNLVRLKVSGCLRNTSFSFHIMGANTYYSEDESDTSCSEDESDTSCSEDESESLEALEVWYSCSEDESESLDALGVGTSYSEDESESLEALEVWFSCSEDESESLKVGSLAEAEFGPSAEALDFDPVAELHLIVESVESCPHHPDNNLPKFQFSCLYREDQPSLTRNLEILLSLGMCACTNLETFSRSICGLRRLRKLKLKGSILEAPLDLGQLECLEELVLSSTKINHLPDSIIMLKNLQSLKLKSCLLLEKLPEDLGRLECLEELILSSTVIKHLPDSICMLKQMNHLELHKCSLLEKLPGDLGRLEFLQWLILRQCETLQDIPDSICDMKCLNLIYLQHCILVEKLPEELGRLECLKVLDIEGTSISRLPQSIHLLKGLCISGSRGLLESSGFTSEIQTRANGTSCYVVVG